MDPKYFDTQGTLLLSHGRHATAQRVLECGALLGGKSPVLSTHLAESMRQRLLQADRRQLGPSPTSPVLDAAEVLAWFIEAMRRGATDEFTLSAGGALAAANWDEAAAQDWVANGIVHGADPVQLWQAVVFGAIACGRTDAAERGLQALGQVIPGLPRLQALSALAEDGLDSQVIEQLDDEMLRELTRVVADLGLVEGVALTATALLTRDPGDMATRELYADVLEQALLGAPGAPTLGGFHPTGAGKALLEMAQPMAADDPDGRWKRRALFARLRGGESPEAIVDELTAAGIDSATLSDAFCYILAEAFLYRAQRYEPGRHMLEFIRARAELTDPRPCRAYAFMTLLQGERFEGLAALLTARRIDPRPIAAAEMTRLRDAYFPEAPLFGDCVEADMTDAIGESLEFLLAGDYDNAQARAVDALAHAEGRPSAEVEVHLVLGECHARPGQMSPRALKNYRRALDAVGELHARAATPAEHVAGRRLSTAILARALPVAHAAGLVGEAFHLIQQVKLTALRDAFAAAADVSPALQQAYVAALPEGFAFDQMDVCPPLMFVGLSELPPEPNASEPYDRSWAPDLDQAVLAERLAAFEAGHGATAFPQRPATVAEVREQLRPGDAFVEFALFPEAAYAVLITRQTTETYAVPLDQSLDAVCRYAWTCLSNPPADPTGWDAEVELWPLRVLYASLIAPLAHALTDCARLIVAPMAGLHRVPFDALHSGSEFLGESFEVVQVPTAAVYALTPPPAPQATYAVPAVGLSTTDADWQAAAAGVRWDGMEWHGGGKAGDALTAEAARAAMLRGALVHVSAPGFVDPDLPACSPVFYGRGLTEPACVAALGTLALPEWQPQLVVLDGLVAEPGRLGSDGEASNPTAALHAAGARTVVATTWRADAPTAAVLFGTFYERLAAAVPAARALHEAKQHLRTTPVTSHPFYWAAPIVSGDPSTAAGDFASTSV